MLNRLLLITYEGAPVCWRTTYGEVRERLAEFPDEDADLLQVWSIHHDDYADKSRDVTRDVAADWSAQFELGQGHTPQAYLSTFPAFVRAHWGDRLVARFRASRDPDYLPSPLRPNLTSPIDWGNLAEARREIARGRLPPGYSVAADGSLVVPIHRAPCHALISAQFRRVINEMGWVLRDDRKSA